MLTLSGDIPLSSQNLTGSGGKENYEVLIGTILVEVGELLAMRLSDCSDLQLQ